jgi:S1-C subfamily serine protease
MFADAARLFWQLKCQAGHGPSVAATRIYGFGCQVSARHVLTALHVVNEADPRVLLDDGLWNCDVVGDWPARDLALLRVTSVAKPVGSSTVKPQRFPQLSERQPSIGETLGYLASLSLNDESGSSSGHTYFGQGHVAFFSQNRSRELVFAMAGGAIQKGFSGGPVFTPTGDLVGVLVEALEYVPDLSHPFRSASAVAILAPIGPIAKAIADIISRDA